MIEVISKRFLLFNILIAAAIIVLLISMVSAQDNTSASSNSTNLTIPTSESTTKLFIDIDHIGDHTIGNIFFINGTTNLPVSEKLTVEILDYYWLISPKTKSISYQPPSDRFIQISNISISPTINGKNRWSVNVTDNIKELKDSEYNVEVYSQIYESCSSSGCLKIFNNQLFTLFPTNNSTTKSNVQLTTIQISPTIRPKTSAVIVHPTKQESPFPLALPIAILAAIVILRPIYGKKRD